MCLGLETCKKNGGGTPENRQKSMQAEMGSGKNSNYKKNKKKQNGEAQVGLDEFWFA